MPIRTEPMKLQLFRPPSTSGELTLIPEATKLKAELLALAEPIQVTTIETRDNAIEIAGKIKSHLKEFEANRVEVKQPFWDICLQIDGLKKEHVKELEAAAKRLDSTVGEFEYKCEQERIRQENELRRQQEEIARKQREAEAAAKRAEEEAARAALEPTLPNVEDELEAQNRKEQAEAEAKRLADEQIKLDQQRQQRAQEEAVDRAGGGSRRMEIVLEITDIHTLYAFNKMLVKMEPNESMIKGFINNGVAEIPGVKWTKRPVFSTNGAR